MSFPAGSLRAPTGLGASLQSVFLQPREQRPAAGPAVPPLTHSRTPVSDRRGFHPPLVSSNDCAINRSLYF